MELHLCEDDKKNFIYLLTALVYHFNCRNDVNKIQKKMVKFYFPEFKAVYIKKDPPVNFRGR